MLAFPALVLLEHGGSLRNKSAATTLLEFLESCGGIRTSPWAHKAAAAFAAAGRHATARAIALNFLASRPARPSDRMWIFRRDESQRRRGRDVDIPWGRAVEAGPRPSVGAPRRSQKADGSFGEGAMGEGDLDQTAEMALWLRVLAKRRGRVALETSRPWGRRDAAVATWIVRGDESPRDAAVATWIVRGDESLRRRRGCDVDSPWR